LFVRLVVAVVESPNWIKNPENNPEWVIGCPNWIKNPENDPEWVVGRPNWIKNPENDPEWVVGRPNWIKNPENNPGRVVVGLNWIKNPENDPEWGLGCPNWIKNPGNDPGSEVVRKANNKKKRPKPQIYRSEATKPLARGEGFGERVGSSSPANNKNSGRSRYFYCSSGWPFP